MSDAKFVPVDLTELRDAGVLMAANERFFWPFGPALTWDNEGHDAQGLGGTASNLHVRQWEWPDGHREGIELEADDPVGDERRRRFELWATERIAALPHAERKRAIAARGDADKVAALADVDVEVTP